MSVTRTPMVFACHSISHLVKIVVFLAAELLLLSTLVSLFFFFFKTALTVPILDYVPVFEGGRRFLSGIPLPLSPGVHAFVGHVGFFPVLQGSNFDFKESYLAYNGNIKVDWKDESSVRRFLYVRSNGVVFDILAQN